MALTLEQFSRELVEIFTILVRVMTKREDNDFTRGKISFQQMVTLHYLSQRPFANLNEIAHVLSIRLSSASVLIDRLNRQQMSTRRRDQLDRRNVRIAITPKGRRVVSQILEQKRNTMKDLFGPISSSDRERFLNIFLKALKGRNESEERHANKNS